jgi:hypothetical protein
MARDSKSISGHAPRLRLYGSESEMMAWVRSALSSQTRRIAGHAKLHLGKEEEAVIWLRSSIEANRNYPASRFDLGGYLKRGQKQRRDLRSTPSSASRVRAIKTRDHTTFLAGREHIYDGPRRAGAPDQ